MSWREHDEWEESGRVWRDRGTPGERFVGWAYSFHVRVFLVAALVVAGLTLCLGV